VTRTELEPMIHRTEGEHANQYTTYAVSPFDINSVVIMRTIVSNNSLSN
jgi:hypothetical protein